MQKKTKMILTVASVVMSIVSVTTGVLACKVASTLKELTGDPLKQFE